MKIFKYLLIVIKELNEYSRKNDLDIALYLNLLTRSNSTGLSNDLDHQ